MEDEKFPFEIFPWNDDPLDITGWVDADQAKAAYTNQQQEIERLKKELIVERAETSRLWALALRKKRK